MSRVLREKDIHPVDCHCDFCITNRCDVAYKKKIENMTADEVQEMKRQERFELQKESSDYNLGISEVDDN